MIPGEGGGRRVEGEVVPQDRPQVFGPLLRSSPSCGLRLSQSKPGTTEGLPSQRPPPAALSESMNVLPSL